MLIGNWILCVSDDITAKPPVGAGGRVPRPASNVPRLHLPSAPAAQAALRPPGPLLLPAPHPAPGVQHQWGDIRCTQCSAHLCQMPLQEKTENGLGEISVTIAHNYIIQFLTEISPKQFSVFSRSGIWHRWAGNQSYFFSLAWNNPWIRNLEINLKFLL